MKILFTTFDHADASFGKFVYFVERNIPTLRPQKKKKINYKNSEARKEAYVETPGENLKSLDEKIKEEIKGINLPPSKIDRKNFSLSHLLQKGAIPSKQKRLIYALLSQKNFIVDLFHPGDVVSIENGVFKVTSKKMSKRFLQDESFDESNFIDKNANTITILLTSNIPEVDQIEKPPPVQDMPAGSEQLADPVDENGKKPPRKAGSFDEFIE